MKAKILIQLLDDTDQSLHGIKDLIDPFDLDILIGRLQSKEMQRKLAVMASIAEGSIALLEKKDIPL